MKGRALVLASAISLATFAALSAGAVASCTSTETVITYSGVCNGTVTFALASPLEGACIEPAADGTIPVTVEALNFALRPPGASCAYVCNCGFLRVYLDDDRVPNNQSGSAVVDAKLASRDGGIDYGLHQLTVELVWDLNDGGGADFYDAGTGSGSTGILSRSVTVMVAPSCKDAGLLADAGSTDAGSTDAGQGDAGSSDAGPTDAGPTDAGSTDAGPTDAGGGG